MICCLSLYLSIILLTCGGLICSFRLIDHQTMSGAVLVAVAAAIGNLLQGWDNATIAGLFVFSSFPFIF